MMPVFLLGLFGTIWAVRESALSERVQESIRYGGAVSLLHDPYMSYSLFSLYNVLDGSPTPTGTCTFDSGPGLSSGRASFWFPTSGSLTQTCTEYLSQVKAVNDGIILQNSIINVGAQAPEGGFLLGNVFRGSNLGVQASQNFFRSPDVGQMAACTPIGNAIKRSLEGGVNDTTTASTAATAMPVTPVADPVIVAPLVCATFAPPSPAPPPTSPPPTPTPTPTGSPTGTPPPTATPTKSPPTPSPTPYRSPSPTPVPTPTGPPTATPAPTQTPAPTPSPTPYHAPTPSPSPTASPTQSPTPKPTATPTATPDPNATPPGSGQG